MDQSVEIIPIIPLFKIQWRSVYYFLLLVGSSSIKLSINWFRDDEYLGIPRREPRIKYIFNRTIRNSSNRHCPEINVSHHEDNSPLALGEFTFIIFSADKIDLIDANLHTQWSIEAFPFTHCRWHSLSLPPHPSTSPSSSRWKRFSTDWPPAPRTRSRCRTTSSRRRPNCQSIESAWKAQKQV